MELTGVFHYLGVILRLQTPEGTLVIEVDDPEVKVTVEGTEVVLHGPGIQEVRLRAGTYKVEGSKEGAKPFHDYVTIKRDGKQVVKVSLEPAPRVDVKDYRTIIPARPGIAFDLGFPIHSGEVRSVTFSPDGKRLATANGDDTISMLDSSTGRVLFKLATPSEHIIGLAVVPDGTVLRLDPCRRHHPALGCSHWPTEGHEETG